jgi:hypothetical protein
MRHVFLASLLFVSAPALIHAEDVNINSRPDTVALRLGAYSVGPSAGVVSALTDPLLSQDPQLLSLSLAQVIRFGTSWDLNIDLDVWVPGGHWGGGVSAAYVFGSGPFQPFLGAGGGMRAVDYDGKSFGRGLGTEGVAYAGLYLDVLDHLQMRMRMPWRFIANSHNEQVVGIDIAMLFSSPHRRTSVRRLVY